MPKATKFCRLMTFLKELPFIQLHDFFNHLVLWDHVTNCKRYIFTPQCLKLPNLGTRWLRVRGFHPLRHMTIWTSGYVKSRDKLRSRKTFKISVVNSLVRVVIYHKELPPIKSNDPLSSGLVRTRDKLKLKRDKLILSPLPKRLGLPNLTGSIKDAWPCNHVVFRDDV